MNIPERWTTGTARASGIDVQYYRTGDGPPIVMAHGLYDNGRRWVPLASDFEDDYDVVMYDARGHGRSDAPETGYDIDDRVADLVGVVNGLGLADPVLLGHSMAGRQSRGRPRNIPTSRVQSSSKTRRGCSAPIRPISVSTSERR